MDNISISNIKKNIQDTKTNNISCYLPNETETRLLDFLRQKNN